MNLHNLDFFRDFRKNTISERIRNNIVFGARRLDFVKENTAQVVNSIENDIYASARRNTLYSEIGPFELLELFNHLRERFDRLVDLADEETIDEILGSDHFLVNYPPFNESPRDD